MDDWKERADWEFDREKHERSRKTRKLSCYFVYFVYFVVRLSWSNSGVAYAKWLFEKFELFDVEPVELLVREDEEVTVSANVNLTKIVLYMPHAYDVELKVDFSEYHCEVIDLENRRPMMPIVDEGSASTIRMSMFNGDALFLAVK